MGGFDAELLGTLQARRGVRLVARISKEGAPVDLEPYLGATAHLVAIRADDLAFLHVHPSHGHAARGEVAFDVHAASEGWHRLFLDFKVRGAVHTAAFTADAVELGARAPSSRDAGERNPH